jgi:hypothetical protein
MQDMHENDLFFVVIDVDVAISSTWKMKRDEKQ